MSNSAMDELIGHFELRVDAFAACHVARHAALRCEPLDQVVVHFVLSGQGMVEYEGGTKALAPGTILVVPAGLSKTISGPGPVEEVFSAKEHCSLDHGIAKFKAGTGESALVLGCAAVQATIGGVVDVFEHLWEPMVEEGAHDSLVSVMALIEQELSEPVVGTQVIISDLMKHILITLFRGQLEREAYRSWLWPAMLDRQLGKAAMAMMARPQDPHNVESLAATAGMSRSRFTAQFTQTFKRSPIEFLQAVRLRAARRMLLSSSLPIKTIAAAVGYSSRSHFCRAFHDRYGDAPSAIRTSATCEGG